MTRHVLILVGLVWVVAVMTPATVAADSRADLKKGLAAADFNRWQEAADHFRAAIAEDPQESSQQVFVSGVFSAPYLPHFQLGQALYRLDAGSRCEEAVAAWDESLRQGVVREFKRRLKELERDRADCLKRLVPSLQRSLNQLRSTLQTGVEAVADGAGDLAAPLAVRREGLAAAWRRFDADAASALRSGEAAALKAAVATGRNLEAQLDDLSRAVMSGRQEALEAARAEALRAVIDAEAAHTSLGALVDFHRDLDPEQGRAYTGQVQSLGELRARLERAADPSAVKDVSQAATEAGGFFDGLRSTVVDRRRRVAARPDDAEGTPSPNTTVPELREGGRTEERQAVESPAVVPPRSTPTSRSPIELDLRRVLDAVGAPTEPDLAWASAYRNVQRLASIDPSSLSADRRRELERQAARGSRALVLLAGMEAFYAGRLRQAVSRLGIEPSAVDGAQDGDLAAECRRLEAHVALFRGAARFRLYRLGGGLDAELLATATVDLRSSRRLDADLEPSSAHFSPALRAAFKNAGPAGSP